MSKFHRRFVIRVRDSQGEKYKANPSTSQPKNGADLIRYYEEALRLKFIMTNGSQAWMVTDRFTALERQLFEL